MFLTTVTVYTCLLDKSVVPARAYNKHQLSSTFMKCIHLMIFKYNYSISTYQYMLILIHSSYKDMISKYLNFLIILKLKNQINKYKI